MAMRQAIDWQGRRLGRYQLKQLFGRGSVSEVWLADDSQLRRQVAIKLLPPTQRSDRGYLLDFAYEARAAAALEHPHILAVYDFGEQPISDDEVVTFLVMPFVTGGSLRGRLRNPAQAPNTEECLRILREAALAIDYAHSKQVLHRDIKPGNMLFQQGWLFLTDFGIARLLDSTTRRGRAPAGGGAAEYTASEQAQGQAIPASDRYSLAVVAYQLFTGRVPFRGETPYETLLKQMRDMPTPPRQLKPTIPPAVEETLLKGLAKRPEDRPISCIAFVEALEKGWKQNVPLQASPSLSPSPGNSNKRTREHFRAAPHLVPYSTGALSVLKITTPPTSPSSAPQAVVVQPVPPPAAPIADQAPPLTPARPEGLQNISSPDLLATSFASIASTPTPTITPGATWDTPSKSAAVTSQTVKTWSGSLPIPGPLETSWSVPGQVTPTKTSAFNAPVLDATAYHAQNNWAALDQVQRPVNAQGGWGVPLPSGAETGITGASGTAHGTLGAQQGLWDGKIGRRELITTVAPIGLAGVILLSSKVFGLNPPANTLQSSSAGPRTLMAGVPVLKLTGHTNQVWAASWDPTGRYLASGAKDSHVMLWDMQTLLKGSTRALQMVASPVQSWKLAGAILNNAIAWSSDGRAIAVTPGSPRSVFLLDIATNAGTPQPYTDMSTNAAEKTIYRGVAWLPGQNTFAVGETSSPRPGLALWQIGQAQKPQGELTYTGQGKPNLDVLAWSLDGLQLASVTDDHHIVIWNVGQGTMSHNLTLPPRANEQNGHPLRKAIAWSPIDAQTLVVSNSDIATVWNVQQESLTLALGTDDPDALMPPQGSTNWQPTVAGLNWSPNGRYLAGSYQHSRRIYIWDTQDNAPKTTKDGVRLQKLLFPLHKDLDKGHREAIVDIAWSPDGRYLASTSLDGTVIIWSVDAG